MAKTGTWYKKLLDKQKKHVMKAKLGNEVGVMNYCTKARPVTARALKRQSIEDKPLPKGPKAPPPEGYTALPRAEGWRPKGFGMRKYGRQSGSYLGR